MIIVCCLVDILAVKQVRLHLDSNQGRQIAGLVLYQLSYRVRQVFTAYVAPL